jgi:TIR domain
LGQHAGLLRISKEGTPVGKIAFQVEVARYTRGARNRPLGDSAQHYRRCFFSYSHPDRAEMLKRAQGVEAAGFDTFIDVLNLRPGDEWNPKIFEAIDESDLFVVIWSKNALGSEWVIKESQHALKRYKQHKSPDFKPIPIEGPPIAPVPESLRGHHFNDEKLFVIRAAELEREKGKS